MGGSRILYVIVAIIIVVGLGWYFGLFGGQQIATAPAPPSVTTAPPATSTPPDATSAPSATTTPPASGSSGN
ncbi:hypothetical protein SAMN07250955_101435 [Arboricoccus pini]|uniref:Uncharacterized protein n=1 Tax=Arboricoccus pini TaxID=1963835 RepID=A0A212Q624_9PROT|nr:hypothetical protein [Arboricoccus pini]SNB54701.1 hypothetical protein SAMN07250955_101435 [Arboricoccus pini]